MATLRRPARDQIAAHKFDACSNHGSNGAKPCLLHPFAIRELILPMKKPTEQQLVLHCCGLGSLHCDFCCLWFELIWYAKTFLAQNLSPASEKVGSARRNRAKYELSLHSHCPFKETVPGKCTDKWPVGSVYKSEACTLPAYSNGVTSSIDHIGLQVWLFRIRLTRDAASGELVNATAGYACWKCSPPRYIFDWRFAVAQLECSLFLRFFLQGQKHW